MFIDGVLESVFVLFSLSFFSHPWININYTEARLSLRLLATRPNISVESWRNRK